MIFEFLMNFLEVTKKFSENCYFVIWKDPREGDGVWKTNWDGKAAININVGWMEKNPNDANEWVLYCSKDTDEDCTERGTEIYIPEGCILFRVAINPFGEGEHFESQTTIRN